MRFGRSDSNVNVLIDNGAYTMRNVGDIAMLQACVDRIRTRYPDCSVSVLTSCPELLELFCPGTKAIHPAGRDAWYAPKRVTAKMENAFGRSLSKILLAVEGAYRTYAPRIFDHHLKLSYANNHLMQRRIEEYRIAFLSANMVVAAGGGYLNDLNPIQTENTLRMISDAKKRNSRTALFGQGLGPMRNEKLLMYLKNACRPPSVVALREGLSGVSLLRTLGLDIHETLVTGDDSIEMSFNSLPEELGSDLGISLRKIGYSGLTEEHLKSIRDVLKTLQQALSTEIVPIPISLNEWEDDASVLSKLCEGHLQQSSEHCEIHSPQQAIRLAGRCRLVISGTYHASVFAMSQGIPALCLYASEYYHDKLKGLQSQFGIGCELVDLNSPNFEELIYDTATNLWNESEKLRTGLLKQATCQIEQSLAAYQRLLDS